MKQHALRPFSKPISIFLLIILLTGIFAACAQEASAPENTQIITSVSTDVENEEEKLSDELPDMNLDGWVLSIVSHHDSISDESTIYTEALNGEIINDEIYNRNSSMEERFNFITKLTPGNGWATDYNLIKNSVLSGSGDYNMCFLLPYASGGNIILNGYLHNMLSVDYLNFEKPWWHNNVNDMFTFYNYLPFVSSDYLLSSYQYANILIFNKIMAENYSTENIYDSVRNGTWTTDKFNRIISVYSNDINGDTVYDVNDMYGFATNYGYHAITWGYAVGEMGVNLSDSGITLGYQSERFYKTAEWLYEIFHNSNLTYEIGWDKECDISWDENRVFIQAMWLADLEKYRDRNSEYGIIPYPKYNEEQELYHTYVDARAGAVAIPVGTDSESISNVGLILEALSCDSYNNLIPGYLGTVTHSKYTRDEESIAMLDYISAGRVWDIGYTFYDNNQYSWVIHHKLKSSKGQLASVLAGMESKSLLYYEKILEAYKTLAENKE